MKRKFAMVALSGLLILTCACGQRRTSVESTQSGSTPEESADSQQPEETQEEGSSSQQADAPARKNVTISELYCEEGRAADSEGTEYQYSYYVPQIEDDTPDAASINEEIAAYYGEIAKSGLQSMKNKEVPGCNIVAYESYRSGDVIGLVIKCAYYYGAYEDFGVYNYDTARGVRLSNADILAMKGVAQEQYLNAVRRAAAKCYDDQYFPIWEDYGFNNLPGAYQERRSFTLSEKNITPELPLYLDDDGVMHTIAAIGSHTGTDWIYQTLTLELEEDTADVETDESFDFLTVTRRGGELTLCFHETQCGIDVLDACGYMGDVPYGRELTVNGLYGDYVRIFCNTIGELGAPYVFLLTEEGRVEYIDVVKCLDYGYFCASGPLLGVSDVKKIVSDSDENGFQSVYAIAGNGERMELDQLIEDDQHNMSDSFIGDWGSSSTVSMEDGRSYEEFLSLTLTDCDNVYLAYYRPELDEVMEYNSYLTYLGMTEKGVVYAYRLWWVYSNGPGIVGVIALNTEFDYSGDFPAYTLNVSELGGTPFIGEQTGETTTLVQSFG